MNDNKGKLKDNDILSLYAYLCEYEDHIKGRKDCFNIYDEAVEQFKKENQIYFGSINNNKDKKKAQKFKNYLLWAEGAIGKKGAKVDRAHALLRRIRNAFAHGIITDKNEGSFELSDYDEKKGKVTLQGSISYQLLYQLINVLKQSESNNLQ